MLSQRDQHPAALRVGHPRDVHRLLRAVGECLHDLPRFHVANLDVLPRRRPFREELAVRRERQRPDAPPEVDPLVLVLLPSPEDEFVAVGDGEQLAVGRELRRVDPRVLERGRLQHLRGRRCPTARSSSRARRRRPSRPRRCRAVWLHDGIVALCIFGISYTPTSNVRRELRCPGCSRCACCSIASHLRSVESFIPPMVNFPRTIRAWISPSRMLRKSIAPSFAAGMRIESLLRIDEVRRSCPWATAWCTACFGGSWAFGSAASSHTWTLPVRRGLGRSWSHFLSIAQPASRLPSGENDRLA